MLSKKKVKTLIKDLPFFEKKVLFQVYQIPIGETRSYKWVAHAVGSPQSARRVGNVLSKTPYPFLIPCHRVIRENGALGGYLFGVDMKRYLLNLEKKANSVIISNIDRCK
ncbi:MAG: MGMT family protein [Candidatus Saelkia tenebricola]|nr:MGMT family protein [Candidatus Saelkia tenebricola]